MCQWKPGCTIWDAVPMIAKQICWGCWMGIGGGRRLLPPPSLFDMLVNASWYEIYCYKEKQSILWLIFSFVLFG
jgi:hypothetical protein